ncbi:hypothetical protein J2X31_001580 [Flavobacterium arsenatis]|uniref:Uncharacterized protein n=1 Tax=Flavobacterium arsenatis TaxID=1484332 RepID=A0ABU1TNN2_9FLAO|nr:hypothetical protein [Flavobacterium arsenatis]MDR6967569.1 hypothetical protein [Flavobacterium arsenatis]
MAPSGLKSQSFYPSVWKKIGFLALMVATILLFRGSEQKIVHPAGTWILKKPERFAPEIIRQKKIPTQ